MDENGLDWEGDPRRAQEVIKALNLEEANPVSTPMTTDKDEKDNNGAEGEDTLLTMEEATKFRAIAARLNYMALDRSDIAVAVMRVCSRMANPALDDWTKLKRIGGYLLHRPRVIWEYRWQPPGQRVEAYSDSDWAGDKITRRSTSGGAIYHGRHLLKTWAKKQAVIAMSSAEAELYAACRCASEALGIQTFMRDLGNNTDVRLHMDSSSALSLTGRQGLGKAKHIAIQHRWIQEAVAMRRLSCAKVHGDNNPADLLTKHMGAERAAYLMRLLGCYFLGA